MERGGNERGAGSRVGEEGKNGANDQRSPSSALSLSGPLAPLPLATAPSPPSFPPLPPLTHRLIAVHSFLARLGLPVPHFKPVAVPPACVSGVCGWCMHEEGVEDFKRRQGFDSAAWFSLPPLLSLLRKTLSLPSLLSLVHSLLSLLERGLEVLCQAVSCLAVSNGEIENLGLGVERRRECEGERVRE